MRTNTHHISRLALMPFLIVLLAAGVVFAEPAGIEWETNMDDPPIGDPVNAVKGGTMRYYMYSYPLTLRLMGPNSNDAFAGWNRAYTMDFALVIRHPTTDNFIPWMATHWSVQDDNKTVYYKLDMDARWSDGTPVTADDYQFTYEMMQSPLIVDPFYNTYAEDYFESVEAIGDDVVKIVGKKESWRPLAELVIWPTPRHATNLDEDWVSREVNTPQIAVGPYTVTKMETGTKVTLTRDPDWWGYGKHYMQGMYNPDTIELKVIPDNSDLDYFKTGQIDMARIMTSRTWANEMDFEAMQMGWAKKKLVFVDVPSGIYGMVMNLENAKMKNKDFRKGLQYMFDFDNINSNLMYNAYYRQVSAFEGTEYANPDLVPYGFNPRQAREHFVAAGFAKRGPDGYLVDANGNRAEFTLIFGSKGLERHLTVFQEDLKKMGIKMDLQLLDAATAFNRGLERKYEAIVTARTANFYPGPKQYFHSEYLKTTNNNNIWAFGSPETDELIETYMFNMDKDARLAAMHELDAIVQDEAFYLPFWEGPYMRIIHWDYVGFPEDFYLPKRTEQLTDYQVWWVNTERRAEIEEAKKAGRKLPVDPVVEVDHWGVRK